MTHQRDVIREVFGAAGGQIIGRIRLQKIFYLLEQKGLCSNFRYSYYHYGPYSEELSKSVEKACTIHKSIRELTRHTVDGNAYSVFEAVQKLDCPERVGTLSGSDSAQIIAILKEEQSVVIELSATIHWLRVKENISDWKSELIKRKTSKASDLNIVKARALLDRVDLF